MALNHFLLIYDLKHRRLVRIDELGSDEQRATAAYDQAEEEYRERSDHESFEIVLVGADSLDTLKVTHSRYFQSERGREEVPF